MYRYSPPKSNVWGHSLRKMEPARQKALFEQFLQKAVADYSITGGSLTLFTGTAPPFLPPEAKGMWGHATHEDVERFEQLLGATASNGTFQTLTAPQCETALAGLVQNSALTQGAMLLLGLDITSWLIEGRPVKTRSMIHLRYGMDPGISTFLEFDTPAQFEFIRQTLADLNFCKLNEKHLKPGKRGNTLDRAL